MNCGAYIGSLLVTASSLRADPPPPYRGAYFCMSFMYFYMITVSHFQPKNTDGVIADVPYVYVFIYDNGKVRMHRRNCVHRIDSWYPSLDAAAPVLNALVNSDKYENYFTGDGDVPEYIINLLQTGEAHNRYRAHMYLTRYAQAHHYSYELSYAS